MISAAPGASWEPPCGLCTSARWRGKDRTPLGQSGPLPSMVGPAFSSDLNGYLGGKARMTRRGEGKATMQETIGVDISKDTLDAYQEGRNDDRQFANSAAGLRAFCRWASGCDAVAIVFEASGAYHRDLERALSRQGMTFAKVNPRQARRFAEAIGRVAKTDKVPLVTLLRTAVSGNGRQSAGQNGGRVAIGTDRRRARTCG